MLHADTLHVVGVNSYYVQSISSCPSHTQERMRNSCAPMIRAWTGVCTLMHSDIRMSLHIVDTAAAARRVCQYLCERDCPIFFLWVCMFFLSCFATTWSYYKCCTTESAHVKKKNGTVRCLLKPLSACCPRPQCKKLRTPFVGYICKVKNVNVSALAKREHIKRQTAIAIAFSTSQIVAHTKFVVCF